MKHRLAIVIPAFKADFFEATLASIAAQTDRRFVLYIGDDASPDDLYTIVSPYQSEIAVVYHRFEQNVGKEDLVAHWERCVALANGEEWVWLFSDDDIMEAGCVSAFYDFLENGNKDMRDVDLIHFDIKVINENNRQVWPFKQFPVYLDGAGFFAHRVRGELHSTVVEYIFRRHKWQQVGQFERFDLAWFTDDATWIKLSSEHGIHSIVGPLVYWRYSGRNISSQQASKELVGRKVQSGLDFMKWAEGYFKRYGLADRTSSWEKTVYLLSVPLSSTALSWKEKILYADCIGTRMGMSWLGRVRAVIYVCFSGFLRLVRESFVGRAVKRNRGNV
ncbi:glycosyltransferase family 2 protein [Parapedobacter soli]|uniref:glycosyltransferase family 2 protein n=1 Tax=Parapedobacter soli TaxID=416955 RepID=UPI0021C6E21F|nr:glycosyltransferase family A protein [Parapedobacter soli]